MSAYDVPSSGFTIKNSSGEIYAFGQVDKTGLRTVQKQNGSAICFTHCRVLGSGVLQNSSYDTCTWNSSFPIIRAYGKVTLSSQLILEVSPKDFWTTGKVTEFRIT